jgi:hypothetical protein
MRIDVASSWRNEEKQQATVLALRKAGHEVHDFRDPAPGNEGFSWTRVAQDPAALKDPRRFRDEVLPHPVCELGFNLDMTALCDADLTVLVLPRGRSAHLELGFAVGNGQPTIVLLHLYGVSLSAAVDKAVRALADEANDIDEVIRASKQRKTRRKK